MVLIGADAFRPPAAGVTTAFRDLASSGSRAASLVLPSLLAFLAEKFASRPLAPLGPRAMWSSVATGVRVQAEPACELDAALPPAAFKLCNDVKVLGCHRAITVIQLLGFGRT